MTESVLPYTYHQSDEYQRAIELLESHSQSHQFLLDIIGKLGKFSSALDVGAGTGTIAKSLASSVKRVVALEPNQAFAKHYEASKVEHVASTLEHMKGDERYDLVVCSHVLYNMPEDVVETFVRRLMEKTKEGGICIIALMSPAEDTDAINVQFNPHYFHSGRLRELLDEMEIRHEAHSLKQTYRSKTLQPLVDLCSFFVWEDAIPPEDRGNVGAAQVQEQVRTYIEKCGQVRDGFQVTEKEEVIVCRR